MKEDGELKYLDAAFLVRLKSSQRFEATNKSIPLLLNVAT